jgi:hypothetical protein
MNRQKLRQGVGVLALGVWMLNAAGPQNAFAHQAKCPFCEKDVVQDTADQDNEVALKYGKKRIEYRCVMCAIADAKNYEGDVTVIAPTETIGKPALITRKGGQWSSDTQGLIFIGEKVNHRHCQEGYRAFTTKEAFDAHVKMNKALVHEAKPVTLAEMVKIADSYSKE